MNRFLILLGGSNFPRSSGAGCAECLWRTAFTIFETNTHQRSGSRHLDRRELQQATRSRKAAVNARQWQANEDAVYHTGWNNYLWHADSVDSAGNHVQELQEGTMEQYIGIGNDQRHSPASMGREVCRRQTRSGEGDRAAITSCARSSFGRKHDFVELATNRAKCGESRVLVRHHVDRVGKCTAAMGCYR